MSGVKRQIDKLGRIAIPMNYRKHLQLTENSYVNISLDNNSVVITPEIKRCAICGATSSLHKEVAICEKCIKDIKELS